jgi:hypothetical protein
MLFDFLNALLSLDIGWFIWMLKANIIYLFAFSAICFFFWEKNMRKVPVAVLLFIIVAWSWVTFAMISGWVFLAGSFLAINYILKIASLTVAEETPALKNKLPLVNELLFVALLIGYNLLLV